MAVLTYMSLCDLNQQYIMIAILVITITAVIKESSCSEYPLLKIDFEDTNKRTYKALLKSIKASSYSEFIATEFINCQDAQKCPKFKVYDPFGNVLQQYPGVSSTIRYMDIINKYININNYPINHNQQQQKLKDQEMSLKIFEERRKLAEMQQSQSWQKSKKKSSSHHKSVKQTRDKGQNTHNNKKNHLTNENSDEQSSQGEATPSKPQTQTKVASRFQTVQHVFAWKIGFICMTVGLIVGMKYLKHQEERLDKMIREEAERHENQNTLDESEGLNDI